MKKLMYLGALSFVFMGVSCNSPSNENADSSESAAVESTETTLQNLKSSNEQDKSLYLWIQDKEELNGFHVYTAKALNNQDTVGFKIHLNANMPAGINADGSVNEDQGFSRDYIFLESIGEASDNFVQVLSELWGVKPVDPKFSDKVELLTFSSNKSSIDYSKPYTANFKVFFNPDASKPGELFLTVDTHYSRITWQSKSEEYSQEIINSLSK